MRDREVDCRISESVFGGHCVSDQEGELEGHDFDYLKDGKTGEHVHLVVYDGPCLLLCDGVGHVLSTDLGTDIVLKHGCSDFGLHLEQDSERMVLLFLALERCLDKLRAQIFGRFVEVWVSLWVIVLRVVCLHTC